MVEKKKNATERAKDTEEAAEVMANSWQKEKNIARMLTNSFVAGLEAGREMEKTAV